MNPFRGTAQESSVIPLGRESDNHGQPSEQYIQPLSKCSSGYQPVLLYC
jgi:hypothetical protein